MNRFANYVLGFGIIGFRDSYGIRPLVMGSRRSANGEGMDYMMASESVALRQLGYKRENIRDILPGEAVIIPKGGIPVSHHVQAQKRYAPDIFEFCYFARPDAIIDGISVHQSRENMGYKLGDRIIKLLTPEQLSEIDVVMPIPETSITSAPCCAQRLGKPYCQGFVKNRYVFRTFIMPGQHLRQMGVRRKLTAMEEQFDGKNVLLVDDSIASPSELIAHKRDEEAITKHIGAEKVIFQSLEDLKESCAQAVCKGGTARKDQEFEVGVFNGNYVTPVPEGYFEHLERVRGETKKMKVMESAREAVANGSAAVGTEEFQMATNGVEVNGDGDIVAASFPPLQGTSTISRGHPPNGQKQQSASEHESSPKNRMDINLHNQADFDYTDL
ncbi:amidophosphoribosyltransferase [Lecanora helva]